MVPLFAHYVWSMFPIIFVPGKTADTEDISLPGRSDNPHLSFLFLSIEISLLSAISVAAHFLSSLSSVQVNTLPNCLYSIAKSRI